MYKLTDIMLQNLEKDLKKFHELFQGGRCQAWQLEELIAKAIRSDFSKSEKVMWKGNGHDIGCDIIVNDTYEIQIKSGSIKKANLLLSGHRLGRFKGNLENITDFLNKNTYLLVAVPYSVTECQLGKSHYYQIFYLKHGLLKIENYRNWQEQKKNFHYLNNQGVTFSIHPSMSWQIWWQIPISILADKSRLITIN